MMDNPKVYDEASEATAEDGVVHVDGPDGVDVNLTPDAALETSDRLLESAANAQGQRVRKGAEWRALRRSGGHGLAQPHAAPFVLPRLPWC